MIGSRAAAMSFTAVLACAQPSTPGEPVPSGDDARDPCRDDGELPVVLDGCSARDARCVLDDSATRLRLWRPRWAQHCTLTLDAVTVDSVGVEIDGGTLTELDVVPRPHAITLRDASGAAVWTVDVVHASPAIAGSVQAQLDDAIAARRAAFMREDWAATIAGAERAYALALQLERWSDACAAAFAGAHVAAEVEGDLDGARAWLARTQTCLAHDPAQTTRLHNHRGRVAALAGDERTALDEYRSAARSARRLGRVDDELAASAAHAELARAAGDGVALAALVERVDALSAGGVDSCVAALAISDVAWAQLVSSGRRAATVDARPALRRALATLAEPRCMRPSVLAHAQLDLALAELHAGAAEAAATVLGGVDRAALDVGSQHWFHDLRVRVGLARGQLVDLDADLAALDRAAAQQRDGELVWRAQLRRGEVELARGHPDDALRSLHRAEQQLDGLGMELALDLGRPQYLAQHRRSSELLVATLVARGQTSAALCIARRARARAVRGLELAARIDTRDAALARVRVELRAARDRLDRSERGSARLPGGELDAAREQLSHARAQLRARLLEGADEPPPPFDCSTRAARTDVLTLTYAAVDDGWIGFAHDEAGLHATPIASFDIAAPSSASTHLLAPFAERIAAAQRVHLVVDGELLGIPIHALPWQGGVLVEHATVAWSVDLAPLPVRTDGHDALVAFADAHDDLGHLGPLVQQTADRLRGQGWSLHPDGGLADRGPSLRSALAEVELFHYVGHAGVPSFERGAPHPWSTMLLLREGTLGIDDVLGLPAVPSTVVLIGCGTALAGPLHVGSGEGLAQAFLAAGAREVIASVGDVDAELAATMGAALYEGPAAEFDAATALARVQRAALGRGTPGDWSALRAWVR